ncbi:MAG: chemotaxis protein CheB [Pseudobdellovibrionaceae bacterium]
MNLSQEEIDLLFEMTEKLTGTCQQGNYRKEVIISNIFRRINELSIGSLKNYLVKLDSDPKEWDLFLSAITIHTTFWFREWPHFEILLENADKHFKRTPSKKFTVWSAACSTGQEIYSIGLLLEQYRKTHIGFDYALFGSDLDPVSVKKATAATYSKEELQQIPRQFQNLIHEDGATFTLYKDILSRTSFFQHNLIEKYKSSEPFDIILCRNVLIYFDAESVIKVTEKLIQHLTPKTGILILGHSETFPAHNYNMSTLGHSCFSLHEQSHVTKAFVDKFSDIQFQGEPDVILIGASTGGPEAICKLLENIPQPCPPVIIVQHINHHFAKAFAERVALNSGLTLNSSEKGAFLQKNNLYMSFGDHHIGIEKPGPKLKILHSSDDPMFGHRPSVDHLFFSAQKLKIKCAAFLLTGMGRDGAEGLLSLKRTGRCFTAVQDAESCVVYGMPKEAVKLNAVDFQGNIAELKDCLHTIMHPNLRKSA